MSHRKHHILHPDIHTLSADLSSHESVGAFCRYMRDRLEQTARVLRERPLKDCLVHTDDIRFRVTSEGGVVLHAREETNRENRLSLLPTSHALRQIVQRVGMGVRLCDLLAKDNPHLLVENLNFLIGNLRPQKFLLRLYGKDKLRAFLSSSFSTSMDNTYLCRALGEVLDGRLVSDNGIENLYINCATKSGGEMLVDIMLPKKEMTVLGEEYQSGLRLRASEIGHYWAVSVEALVTRLICENGMSATFGNKRASISYYAASLDHEKLVSMVDGAISAGMKDIRKTRDIYESRVNRLIGDAKENPKEFDDNDVRVAVAYIIQRSAMGVAGGVFIEDVVVAYEEEKNKHPGTNTAWLLVNAFTRYATHYLLRKQNNLHLAQVVQKSVFETMLNPQRITWGAIIEEVQKKKEKADESSEHDEDEY